MAYTEIDYLRDQASNKNDEDELKKLDEINQFIMSIEKIRKSIVDFNNNNYR